MSKKLIVVIAAVLHAGQLVAQQDGPGRGVARISVLNGEVSVKRGDSGDFVAAAINAPLVVQDRIVTAASSRAEVQFDYANMIRLSSNAEVRFAELEYKRYIVQVALGTTTFRVLRDQDADVEISTPSISVRPVKRGIYRVTVHEDGTSEITVRSGEVEIYTPRGTERLRSGHTMLARGTAADPEFRTVSEIRDDDWDRWNQHRDRDLEHSRSYAYVSRDIYGAEDLDDHGRWINTPDYGYVWSPRVAPGWAPYRYGRWSWIDWYGWSWLSYDPWGWAPYHYGRWYHHASYGWCWYPGGLSVRHYWSPALVAFFGVGSVGAGLGFGNIGWVPLGPREPFYPWWGSRYYGGYRNGGYYNNSVRVVNNINITDVYRNARVRDGVTVIDHDGFSRGRAGNAFRVTDAGFREARVVQGQLPVTPGRESLRLADRDARVPAARGREAEQFYSRRAPAQVDRVPFEEQRRGMEQVTRRSFADDGVRNAGVPLGSPARVAPEATRSAEDAAGRGWRRAAEPVGGGAAGRSIESRSTEARGADENGWRRFGSARTRDTGAEAERPGRFGEPAAARGAEGMSRSLSTQESNRSDRQSIRSADSDGWRRFGSAGARTESFDSSRSAERSVGRRDSMVRTEDRVASPPGAASPQGAAAPRGADSPRGDFGRGSSMRLDAAPRAERGGGGESIRISPPIVRERSSGGDSGQRGGGAMAGPRGGDGGSRGSGGGMSQRGAESGGGGRGGDGGGRGGRGR